jgi:membrane fusion protein (multidrug efflux system)
MPQGSQDLGELHAERADPRDDNDDDVGPRRPAAHFDLDDDGHHTAETRPARRIESERPQRRTAKPDESEDQEGADAKSKQDNAKEDESDDEGKGGEKPGVWGSLRKHPIAVGVAAVVLIAAIALGVIWYLNARHFESTDDAFIDGRPVSVSPEVTGNIVNVPVNDNQVVHAGDLLVEIDERDYRAALRQAIAQIAQGVASVASYKAQVKSQYATIDETVNQETEARAALNFSLNQNTRAQDLVKTGAGTVQAAQQSAADVQSKQAAFNAAAASLLSAKRQIDVLTAQVETAEAQIEQAEAQKEMADANLSRTRLHATVDGRVTRLTAAVGAVATQAQTLMVLVPLDLWVTANFKETQLADMKVGQPVDIEIDSLGKTFHGHVNSLQAGSGTAFSLLPAENATGNYVKVVQRVPVKITFDDMPDVELGPGMSVVPTVTVR